MFSEERVERAPGRTISARPVTVRRKRTVAPLLVALVLAGGAGWARDAAMPVALIQQVAANKSTAYVIDRPAYAAPDLSSLPIGVFDSGIGGLTVLNAIMKLDEFNNRTHQPGPDGVPDFANEHFVYFGDQANMPYGNYPSAGREDFLRELIVEDALFLLGRRYWPTPQAAKPADDKPPVKAIVVACNTATAYGIEDLRAALDQWKVPIILVGVVEAGAEGTVAALAKQREPGAVAVMATAGTCRSGAYPRAIDRYARRAGARPPTVVQQGSVGLAGAIEGDPAFVRAADARVTAAAYKGPAVDNKEAPIQPALAAQYAFDPAHVGGGDARTPASWRLDSVENYVRYDVTSMVESYAHQKGAAPISTVVLGCTHFPFVRERIAQNLARLRDFRDASGAKPYSRLIAADVAFVDPAQLTARQLYVALSAKGQLLEKGRAGVLAKDAYYISKPNPSLPEVKLAADGGFDPKYKYGRLPGHYEHDTVRRVPMRVEDLTPAVRGLVQSSMPALWQGLAGNGAPAH